MRRLMLTVVLLMVVLATGCSSTTFESVWKDPDAGPGDIRGKKIVAIAVTPSVSKFEAEDTIANRLKEEGADAVQSYLILAKDASKEEAKKKLQQDGIKAAVIMRLVGTDKEIRSTGGHGTYYGAHPYSRGFYGGAWGGGWAVSTAPEIRTDTLVYLETLVFSVEHDKLIWAARTKTFNPSDVGKFVGEVIDGAIKQMKSSGLIISNP